MMNMAGTDGGEAHGIVLREAGEEDLPAVLALVDEPGKRGGRAVGLEEARQILSRMRSYPSYRLMVAELGERIVGTYSLLVIEHLAHAGSRSAIVEQVFVADDARRTGVGRAMMHHAMKLAAQSRCYKLTLSSSLARTDAHAFYDNLGFERHGVSFLIAPRAETPS